MFEGRRPMGRARGFVAAALYLAVVCSLSLAASSCAEAGAWTLGEGAGQVIVTGLYSSASAIFDDHGDDLSPIDFDKATGSILAEYGVRDDLTLIGSGEFGFFTAGPFEAAVTNVAFGARQRLYRQDGFVLSGQAIVGVDRDDPYGGRDVSLDAIRPQLEARLLAGYAFAIAGKSAFVDGQAAYRVQFADRPDEARFDLTLGFRPTEKVLLLVQTASTFSLGSRAETGAYRYHKAGASIVYDLNESLSVQFGGFATVYGRNALRERGAVSALWYRF